MQNFSAASRLIRPVLAALLFVVFSALLTGCNGGEESTATAGFFSNDSMPEMAMRALEADGMDMAESLEAVTVERSAADSGPALGALLGRKIIREGSLVLEVADVPSSLERAKAIADSNGGYVANSHFYGDSNKDPEDASFSAFLSLRIPSDKFEAVTAQLEATAERVISSSTSSQDVTGQVTDWESDLRNLAAVERQYLTLLTRADEIEDILGVTDRLNSTRREIENIESQLAVYESLIDLSTINVDLISSDDDDQSGFGIWDAALAGWQASLDTLEFIAKAILAAVAFSWWLAPVVVLLALLLRQVMRRRRRTQANADSPTSATSATGDGTISPPPSSTGPS